MNNRRFRVVAAALLLAVILLAVFAVPHYYGQLQMPKALLETANGLADSINSRDEQKHMVLIDQGNNEFYIEEKHMFKDIAKTNLKACKIKILDYERLTSDTIKAGILESYTLDGKSQKLKYDAVFKLDHGRYKFSDIYFDKLETQHFTIKYAPSLKKKALLFQGFVEKSYGNVKKIYGEAPEDKTVVKIYDDNDVFGAFIKPSIKFKMSGWYEYPESIKINMSNLLDRVMPDSAFETYYMDTLSHELTHRTNGIESHNNIPYWMAEGLATYVQYKGEPSTVMPEWTLTKLETINLEKLTDSGEIDEYYRSSYINISLFIKRYGLDELHRLMDELGKFPLQENTSGESFDTSNSRFRKTVKKLYNMTLEQLEKELYGVADKQQ